MPDQKVPQSASEMLDAIVDFVEDADEDISALSRDEVQARLIVGGIGFTGRHAEMRRRFQAIEGKERREKAAARRQALETRPPDTSSPWTGGIESVRPALTQRLNMLREYNPDMAATYFRNLSEATEDDLRQMMSDLDALEGDDQW